MAEELTFEEMTAVKSPVSYKLRWLDNDGDLLKTFDSDVPFSGLKVPKLSLPTGSNPIPTDLILQVEQTVRGPHSSMESLGDSIKNKMVDDIVVSEVQPTKIIVHSRLLIGAIYDTVPYYPSQALRGKTITITEPFAVLMHYLDDFTRLHREEVQQSTIAGSETGPNKNSLANHLEVLLHFLQPYVSNTLGPIIDRLGSSEPAVTFDTLWYLFKPGVDVYTRDPYDETIHAWVVTDFRAETAKEAEKRSQKPGLILTGFNLESDGSRITRNSDDEHMRIDYFEGEQEVTSLYVYPCEYWDRKDGGTRRRDYIKAGQRHLQLLRKGSTFMRYSGYVRPTRRLKVRRCRCSNSYGRLH